LKIIRDKSSTYRLSAEIVRVLARALH